MSIQAQYPIKTALMNVMTTAARKASRGLIRDFGEVGNLQVTRKGVMNFVSEADTKCEQQLQYELKKARPNYGFLMEEGGEVVGKDSSLRWVIDPLDGTTNFLHAVPYFAISIALEKTHDDGEVEILAGVVYDPIHDEMFIAEKGEGAFVNEQRIRVTERKDGHYFVTGTARIPSDYTDESSHMTRFATSQLECILRRSGAAALDLAYVAAGRYDACWFPCLKKWDIAAGIIIVKEAGGEISRLGVEGDYYETGAILAASKQAHKKLKDTTIAAM